MAVKNVQSQLSNIELKPVLQTVIRVQCVSIRRGGEAYPTFYGCKCQNTDLGNGVNLPTLTPPARNASPAQQLQVRSK